MNIPDIDYKDYPAIHDLFFELSGDDLSTQEIDMLISSLPTHIQLEGVQWGWGDTCFRDQVFAYFKKQMQG